MNGEPVTALGGEGVVLDGAADARRLGGPHAGHRRHLAAARRHGVVPHPRDGHLERVRGLEPDGRRGDRGDPAAADDPTIVTATSGTGTRGTFDVEVPCTPPDGGGTALPRLLVGLRQGRLAAGCRVHPGRSSSSARHPRRLVIPL